ncbi:hypothetical protein BJX63DRAFT_431390 [Aspergillus granulosus]|uniref:Uncharacterized protein n=1 Tax=Aspergillus granulosus TaxID=176169 RepID=A0ABR4HG84_9EURO
MAFRRESFSSLTSTSSSSFSSSSSTTRTRGTPTQKLKFKRWFSSQLPTSRQPSNSATATATATDTTAPATATTTTTATLAHDNPTTGSKRLPTSSASQSQSQSSSSLGINPHHDPDHSPELNPALYQDHRGERTIHLHTEYTSPNDPLSDSYAAYCREFTSSPSPEHQRQKRTPLPRLPASTSSFPGDENGLGIEPETHRTSAPEHSNSPDFEPGSTFAIRGANASAAEATPATTTHAASVPTIRFLPVGAHGYQPASWALPRPPTPPPGILTPARYEEMQRRAAEEEREKKDKKREGGLLTWCLPIRVSWLPWGRPKGP